MSPVDCAMSAFLFFNALSHPLYEPSNKRAIETGMAILDFITDPTGENLHETDSFHKFVLSLGQYRLDIDDIVLDPNSALVYPIFDSFEDSRKEVGTLGTTLNWFAYFQDVLPPNALGIYCVIKNTAGQAITYRLDGSSVTFLGSGDLHDSTYDDYEIQADAASYYSKFSSPETKSYTSVEIDFDFMSYSLHVFPSQETEDYYVNGDALVFTVIILAVFLFTSLVFTAYDFLVARRQRIVMDRAVASGAIVSSLFPSQVRDQLYQERETKTNTEMKGGDDDVKRLMSGDEVVPNSRKIAQVYPETTIMFADLAGFTNWSSTRTPEQVFELLETLYQAFDKLAIRRRVFKVCILLQLFVSK